MEMNDPKIFTPVATPPLPHMQHGGTFVMIGSCFAAEMGSRLQQQGDKVVVNPLGTLFNPLSIAMVIHDALREESARRERIVERNGRWVSFDCHSDVCGESREELRRKIAEGHTTLRESIRQAGMVVVTFGTALLFRRNGEVVANCHKQPSKEFEESFATVGEIVETWHGVLGEIREINPNVEIVLTVSPVRHLLSGVHRNAVSKALLLEATRRIVNENARCHYFPAFEIVLDELRDYRFFSDDLAHPSPLTVSIVTERFWHAIGGNVALAERNERKEDGGFVPILSSPRLASTVQVPRMPSLEVSQEILCVGGAFASTLATLLPQCGLYASSVSPQRLSPIVENSPYIILCVETDGTPNMNAEAITSVRSGILMVSPMRRAATPAESSAYNHAKVLLEAHRLLSTNQHLSYFPSYEILHDELRDYRYYANDLLSPSPLALRIITGRLVSSMVDAAGLKILQRYEALQQTRAHRPSDPNAPAYLSLLQKLRAEANALAPLLHPAIRSKIVF